MPRTAHSKTSPTRPRPIPKFVAGATTLYAQLASVLRSRILDGEWAPDSDIPSIEDLCTQYGLGRVTVRQALQILASEGLVSSQRGRRTFVTYSPQQIEESPLFTSLAAVDAQVPGYTIRVISRKRVDELPSTRWKVGQSIGPYMHMRKVDCTGDQPYAYSDLYIPEDIYKRFPKGAENRLKLVRLVVKYSSIKVTLARERVRVAAADFAEADALGCNMAAPVARVERVFCDANGRVVYLGNSTYLGDRYNMERKLDEYLEDM